MAWLFVHTQLIGGAVAGPKDYATRVLAHVKQPTTSLVTTVGSRRVPWVPESHGGGVATTRDGVKLSHMRLPTMEDDDVLHQRSASDRAKKVR